MSVTPPVYPILSSTVGLPGTHFPDPLLGPELPRIPSRTSPSDEGYGEDGVEDKQMFYLEVLIKFVGRLIFP